ncbi:HNH endonuclease [Streptomyces sp. NPDC088729]|uniref:HNH endonuclease signature motif containing protein n=1 Tax=Streptomyces sp. NPDC088729 TaxID=3365876 RepID=UPI00381607ED
MSTHCPRDRLARYAATARSLVDLLHRLGAPVGSASLRYVRGRLIHYGIDTSHFVEEALPARERRTYPKEVLAEAAAHSHSIRDMFTYLGLPPGDRPYSHLRRRMDQLGIDTTHFTSGRRCTSPSNPRTALAEAIARSNSLAGALRILGLADSSSARARLKRDAEAHGLSTAHFTGQGHGRGNRSRHRKSADQVLRRPDSGASRTKTAQLRRALDDVGVPRVCTRCGTGDAWRGKQLVLEIDHINGDRLDNRRENLRYLCPSCHSQTRTFSRTSRAAQ